MRNGSQRLAGALLRSQHYNKNAAQQSQGRRSDLESTKPEQMDFARLQGTLLASGLWWYAYVEHLL